MPSEWGEMVFPGVYMSQKPKTSDALAAIVKEDGSLNYELIYLEIEELSTHIERLKASNIEIEKYIAQKGSSGQGREDDEDENCMSGLANNMGHLDKDSSADDASTSTDRGDDVSERSSNEDEGEEDLEVFREALLENENVIFRKEKELELLTKLVKDQKCGCSFHTHGQHHAHSGTECTAADDSAPTTDTAPHDRITL